MRSPGATKTDQEIEDIATYYSTQRALASIEQLTTGKELTAKFDRCHAPTDWERKINVSSLTGQSHD